jgi:hypothetical protein
MEPSGATQAMRRLSDAPVTSAQTVPPRFHEDCADAQSAAWTAISSSTAALTSPPRENVLLKAGAIDKSRNIAVNPMGAEMRASRPNLLSKPLINIRFIALRIHRILQAF